MWQYTVATGVMRDPTGRILTDGGYSGNGADINNPTAEGEEGHGPIPAGGYTMGPWFDDTGGKGPIVTRLIPDPENVMDGRSGFMIHGDNIQMNHTASDGCIILPHFARQVMSQSPDQRLEVA